VACQDADGSGGRDKDVNSLSTASRAIDPALWSMREGRRERGGMRAPLVFDCGRRGGAAGGLVDGALEHSRAVKPAERLNGLW
jgi:hypothetical protein